MQPVKHSQQVKRKEVAADNKWGYVMLIAKCVCVGGALLPKTWREKKKNSTLKRNEANIFLNINRTRVETSINFSDQPKKKIIKK